MKMISDIIVDLTFLEQFWQILTFAPFRWVVGVVLS